MVLIGLVTFIVPVFVGVFSQFGGKLPTITAFTVGLSHAMTGYWWAFIAVTVRPGHPASASGRPATRGAGSGTPSACASR